MSQESTASTMTESLESQGNTEQNKDCLSNKTMKLVSAFPMFDTYLKLVQLRLCRTSGQFLQAITLLEQAKYGSR